MWCFQDKESNLLEYKNIMNETVQYIFDNEDELHYQDYVAAHHAVFQVLKTWEAQDLFLTVIDQVPCPCWLWLNGKLMGKKCVLSRHCNDTCKVAMPCKDCGRTLNEKMGALFGQDFSQTCIA